MPHFAHDEARTYPSTQRLDISFSRACAARVKAIWTPEFDWRACARRYSQIQLDHLLRFLGTSFQDVASTDSLAAAGHAGVERSLGLLQAEIERDMKLMGCTSISQLTR